ncbi:MAG TPA: histidine kinase [Bacteroidales bacterium]|nr:histidine kinase [Bacteroidales bacterium]
MIDNKSIEFFVNMGIYKSKYVSFRILITSILAVFLIFIADSLISPVDVIKENIAWGYLIAIVGFNCITELNIFMINMFKASERYNKNLYVHILVMFLGTVLITYIFIIIAQFIIGSNNLLQHEVTQMILILGLLILLIHLLVIVLSSMTKVWIDSKKELGDLKQAKLLSDYNSLKDRLNPHFLFNNLSVLRSLIRYNPTDAEIFTQNFTNVYRYVLNSHEKDTVLLESELEFLNSYIALHKERIGDGLEVSISINDDLLKSEIPPMTLQLLFENAIKHNIANKSQKLCIEIESNISENSLIVRNNINKKETTYSTQTGLDTLKAQYLLVGNKTVDINDDGKFFTVKIPLL